MGEKLNKIKKAAKEGASDVKQSIEFNTYSGKVRGAEWFLKYYNLYRVLSGILLFIGAIALFIYDMPVYGVILLVATHFHVFLNQIFWKLRGLEDERTSKEI